MEYFEGQLFEYMTKKCKTFDNATRSIHNSELVRICHHFKLDYRIIESIKYDSQGRVAFADLRYAFHHDSSKLSPAAGIQSLPPSHQTTSTAHYMQPSSSRQTRHQDLKYYTSNMPPYETDESYTPDHEYTPDDINYHQADIRGCISPSNQKSEYDTHWSNPGSPPDAGVTSHQQQWGDNYVTTTATPSGRRGANYCTNCNYWQTKAQDLEDQLVSVNRQVDRLQKELQQSADYYSAYQMVKQENNRVKQELKKSREGSISDGGSASYLERQLDDLKRSKEELEDSVKQYKRHCSGLKQENDRLRYESDKQQKSIWFLQDEKQRLETAQLQRDAKLDSRMPPGVYNPAAQYQQQPPSDPEVDFKISRNKQVMPEGSENSQGQVFVVLGEDVSSSVLPESLSEEQHYQLVCGLQNCHSIEELLRCLVSYGFGSAFDDKSQGIKVENDHLKSQVKSLEAKYNTLSSSFEAAKLESEGMFHKLSSVEANNCRLRRAVKLCQQACEVHEMLYEMKEAEARPPSTSSAFSPMEFDSPTRTTNHDISASKNVLSRVRALLKTMETNQELQTFLPTVHGKTSTAGWNLSMSQYTGTTSGLSCASSLGPEAELNSTEVEQLKVYYQALVRYSKHLIDTLIEVDGLQGVDSVKTPNNIKDCISSDIHGGRIIDMEEAADTEELCKIREEKAELRSQIYMMEQSKRSMELQLSRKTLHCFVLERQYYEQRNLYQAERKKKQRLKEKIKQLKSENPHVPDWTEQNEQLKVAWESEKLSSQRYNDLFSFMQSHLDKSQSVTEKLVEFVKELLRANRALVEAFERAKKRQQTEKKQLKSELKSLMQKPHSIGQL